MEITKIFSEIGGEEKLYSISLDETEMILFSEFQKEFNSKSQKALKRKWETNEGLKAAQADEFGASMARSNVMHKKGGSPILGINKSVSQDEMAVNLARDNNKFLGDNLKYRQEDIKSARRYNPKATFKDTMKDYEWDSEVAKMNIKKEIKANAQTAKKKAENLKKVKNIAKKSALGTAAVVGTGIVAKKIYDKNKKDKK